jgi:hypothetical protein
MHPYLDDTLPIAAAVNMTNGVTTGPSMNNSSNGITSLTAQMA